MSLLSPIKDHYSERRLFVSRVLLSIVVGTLLLGVVVARLVQLQIIEYEHFAEQAQGNRLRIQAIPPTRGLIFDRNGRVLAENVPTYQLELIPEQVPDIDDTLRRLDELGLIDEEDIPRIKQASREGPRFKPVTLRFRLQEEEIANFAIRRPRFPGVDFQPRLVRHYPHGEYTAHAVGYVGAISVEDLKRLDEAAYAGTVHTGKTGAELANEDSLHGDPGYRQIVTNARGREVAVDTRDPSNAIPEGELPVPGLNVYLSIDLDLQVVATDLLRGKRGSVVAIDPNNGEVLALVSSPSFDPNVFPLGMTRTEFNALQFNLDQPLFNRAVRGTYPPGSTIKPMLSLAALETGATNLTRRTLCRGFYTLPGSTHRYRDWRPEGHGEVDLHDAIAESCDVYFYEISRDIGIEAMHDYLTRFGLGSTSGIDISGEMHGLVPSREWKRQAFRERADQVWFPGETVIASIGQGYMLATPLQLANSTATLAMRGHRFRPRLAVAIEEPVSGERRLLPPHALPDVGIENEFYWESVLGAMHDVLQGETGTARATGRGAPYTMAGKSGTAQVFSVAQEAEYEEEEVEERLRDHALFIAFAPVEEPKIAVAVVIENGSSGSRIAAPIARAIMDKYLGY
ncbi:MAG: penicillin-binding protein 2 [Gammaproteobacteria bacterium]|nr:penicillin-binding protein 2 [Gammaproteobacteria bacterium]MDH4254425.1 penicillin-binding protein 2 [Gammaproteobacteria bacterium]MDH5311086.1 penicillin-binding protein 2 [Gammaproteobacteria bacterium]